MSSGGHYDFFQRVGEYGNWKKGDGKGEYKFTHMYGRVLKARHYIISWQEAKFIMHLVPEFQPVIASASSARRYILTNGSV